MIKTILDVYKFTNRQMGMLKIGASHLDKRTDENVNSGFSDTLKPVQEFCKKEGISYVYILPKTKLDNNISQ